MLCEGEDMELMFATAAATMEMGREGGEAKVEEEGKREWAETEETDGRGCEGGVRARE